MAGIMYHLVILCGDKKPVTIDKKTHVKPAFFFILPHPDAKKFQAK